MLIVTTPELITSSPISRLELIISRDVDHNDREISVLSMFRDNGRTEIATGTYEEMTNLLDIIQSLIVESIDLEDEEELPRFIFVSYEAEQGTAERVLTA